MIRIDIEQINRLLPDQVLKGKVSGERVYCREIPDKLKSIVLDVFAGNETVQSGHILFMYDFGYYSYSGLYLVVADSYLALFQQNYRDQNRQPDRPYIYNKYCLSFFKWKDVRNIGYREYDMRLNRRSELWVNDSILRTNMSCIPEMEQVWSYLARSVGILNEHDLSRLSQIRQISYDDFLAKQAASEKIIALFVSPQLTRDYREQNVFWLRLLFNLCSWMQNSLYTKQFIEVYRVEDSNHGTTIPLSVNNIHLFYRDKNLGSLLKGPASDDEIIARAEQNVNAVLNTLIGGDLVPHVTQDKLNFLMGEEKKAVKAANHSAILAATFIPVTVIGFLIVFALMKRGAQSENSGPNSTQEIVEQMQAPVIESVGGGLKLVLPQGFPTPRQDHHEYSIENGSVETTQYSSQTDRGMFLISVNKYITDTRIEENANTNFSDAIRNLEQNMNVQITSSTNFTKNGKPARTVMAKVFDDDLIVHYRMDMYISGQEYYQVIFTTSDESELSRQDILACFESVEIKPTSMFD